jgi:hypothetical protein
MPSPSIATDLPNVPMVDAAGMPNPSWRGFFMALWRRTGQAPGVMAGPDVSSGLAAEAQTRASADAALTNGIAQGLAQIQAEFNASIGGVASGLDHNGTAVSNETARAQQAEALLAPKANPVGSGVAQWDAYRVTAGGPTWTTGATVPGTTQPLGSLYSRTSGGVGSTLYVSRGGGTWLPVAGV